ncbi:YutD family protein [Paenibacillus sp. PsM32]|uniref:YutD family protein n=1 Tax=Paenibacillus sp. PsM32 TaxID=3030536 RepID=UPI00263AA714|nr:YutD family protein [Paenibacillus sp. PsM32]MDN4621027.1 YutD family protein [Paenibacillus sp. PsM32]
MIQIGGKTYEIIKEHRDGWNAEIFRERYSEVLDRYDYILGDWGYNQLRLKGFYRDGHPKAGKDTSLSSLTEYINEYCNFGCAYFVLQKTKEVAEPPKPANGEKAEKSEKSEKSSRGQGNHSKKDKQDKAASKAVPASAPVVPATPAPVVETVEVPVTEKLVEPSTEPVQPSSVESHTEVEADVKPSEESSKS